MSKNEQGLLPDIDEALKQMAAETPEIPESFHDAWIRAVKKEKADPQNTEGTVTPAKSAVPEIAEMSRKRRIPWTRIGSVAAALAILLAGTAAVRDGRLTREQAARVSASAPMSFSSGTGTGTAATAGKNASEAPVMYADSAAVYEEAEVYKEADAAYEEVAVSYDAEEAECEEAAAEASAEVPADRESKQDIKETEEPSFFGQIGVFFSDMATFLMTALPFIAILAAASIVIRIIVKKRKARKSPKE